MALGEGISSIFENIFKIIGKVLLTALFTVSKALESVLRGLNNHLHKRIQQ